MIMIRIRMRIRIRIRIKITQNNTNENHNIETKRRFNVVLREIVVGPGSKNSSLGKKQH